MKHPSYDRPAPQGEPLPPGTVYLKCRKSGDWVGDVLEARPGTTWHRGHPRYHWWVSDDACRCGGRHIRPTAAEVEAAVAKAKRKNASIPLSVDIAM